MIPKVHCETRVASDDASDQMIFKGLNGALGRVGLLQMGRHNLKRDSLVAHKIL